MNSAVTPKRAENIATIDPHSVTLADTPQGETALELLLAQTLLVQKLLVQKLVQINDLVVSLSQ
jgi:hypothetical protein